MASRHSSANYSPVPCYEAEAVASSSSSPANYANEFNSTSFSPSPSHSVELDALSFTPSQGEKQRAFGSTNPPSWLHSRLPSYSRDGQSIAHQQPLSKWQKWNQAASIPKRVLIVAAIFVFGLLIGSYRQSFFSSSHSNYSPNSNPSESLSIPHGKGPHSPENDILLITKTGSATVFDRLMIHLAEAPLSNNYYANTLYVSDYPVKVGNVEFFDALANVSSAVAESNEFRTLRQDQLGLIQSNQPLDKMKDAEGGWKLDKYKFLPMMAEAYRRYPNVKWYVMVEADTFLFWNQLVKWLGKLNSSKHLYLGHPSFASYDDKSMMFAHGGSGFVLSQRLMADTFGKDADFEHTHDHRLLQSFWGDALLSQVIWEDPHVSIKELSKEGGDKFNSDPPRELKFRREIWCTPILTFHHVSPNDVYQLYDFQRRIEPRLRGDDMIRWADVWDEFIPDFLAKSLHSVRHMDDSASFGQVLEKAQVSMIGWEAFRDWDSETTDSKSPSAEDCQAVCRASPDCMMWTWFKGWKENKEALPDPKFGTCRYTSEFLRIGTVKPNNRDVVSGWNMDRIEKWRKTFDCSGRTGLNVD